MDVIFSVTDSTLITELFGELDHHAAETARNKIDRAFENYRTANLIFDFAGVSFRDSSGIGMILGRYRKLKECGAGIAICACSKTVRNIMNMAGVFSIIDYYDTKEDAIDSFKRKEVS